MQRLVLCLALLLPLPALAQSHWFQPSGTVAGRHVRCADGQRLAIPGGNVRPGSVDPYGGLTLRPGEQPPSLVTDPVAHRLLLRVVPLAALTVRCAEGGGITPWQCVGGGSSGGGGTPGPPGPLGHDDWPGQGSCRPTGERWDPLVDLWGVLVHTAGGHNIDPVRSAQTVCRFALVRPAGPLQPELTAVLRWIRAPAEMLDCDAPIPAVAIVAANTLGPILGIAGGQAEGLLLGSGPTGGTTGDPTGGTDPPPAAGPQPLAITCNDPLPLGDALTCSYVADCTPGAWTATWVERGGSIPVPAPQRLATASWSDNRRLGRVGRWRIATTCETGGVRRMGQQVVHVVEPGTPPPPPPVPAPAPPEPPAPPPPPPPSTPPPIDPPLPSPEPPACDLCQGLDDLRHQLQRLQDLVEGLDAAPPPPPTETPPSPAPPPPPSPPAEPPPPPPPARVDLPTECHNRGAVALRFALDDPGAFPWTVADFAGCFGQIRRPGQGSWNWPWHIAVALHLTGQLDGGELLPFLEGRSGWGLNAGEFNSPLYHDSNVAAVLALYHRSPDARVVAAARAWLRAWWGIQTLAAVPVPRLIEVNLQGTAHTRPWRDRDFGLSAGWIPCLYAERSIRRPSLGDIGVHFDNRSGNLIYNLALGLPHTARVRWRAPAPGATGLADLLPLVVSREAGRLAAPLPAAAFGLSDADRAIARQYLDAPSVATAAAVSRQLMGYTDPHRGWIHRLDNGGVAAGSQEWSLNRNKPAAPGVVCAEGKATWYVPSRWQGVGASPARCKPGGPGLLCESRGAQGVAGVVLGSTLFRVEWSDGVEISTP